MPPPRVIIVTGANRGIGRAICQSILSRPLVGGSSTSPPAQLLATSRNGEDLALSAPEGASNAAVEVSYAPLDIASRDSVRAFAADVARRHGHVDVLINNAGVNFAEKEYGVDTVRTILDVNYRGTLQMCQSFLPILSKSSQPGGGRIVNLSSVASGLKIYSAPIQARFRNPDLTLDELEQLAQEFEASVHTQSNTFVADPTRRAYPVSKACVNALTRILAREHRDVAINACCPGWVATDMGGLVGRAPKTAAQGARIPVRLALDDDLGGVSGAYWANDGVRSKEGGRVQEW